MNRLLFIVLIVMGFAVSSCVETLTDDGLEPETAVGMESLIIPDGFNFSNVGDVTFKITTEGTFMYPQQFVSYTLWQTSEDTLLLNSSIFAVKQGLETRLSLPNHATGIKLVTSYMGKSIVSYFEKAPVMQVNLTEADLVMQRDDILAANARVSRGCMPDYVGVDFAGWKVGYDILFYSQKDISNLVIDLADREDYKIEDPESIEGDNKGEKWEWEQEDFPYTLTEIKGVWIKSGCNSSDDGPGYGEYVVNPYFEEGDNDKDGDGVPDNQDADPNDKNVATVSYLPAQNSFSTLAFEDNWPSKGDYDFNDLVIYYNYTISANAAGEVTKVAYKLTPAAIGATFNNDFCLNIPGDASLSNAESFDIDVISIDNQGSTILTFQQIRSLYDVDGFVNTLAGSGAIETRTLSGIIDIDGNTAVDDFKIDGFINVNQQNGREVHLPGVSGTSWVDTELYGTSHDDSNPASGKYYQTTSNLPWAIDIPVMWQYPQEYIDITEAYKRFATYAESNENLVWYTATEENQNSSLIY